MEAKGMLAWIWCLVLFQKVLIDIYISPKRQSRAVQTRPWRAGVLQSLAPTCLKTPAWKFLHALQDRVWTALG